MSSLGKALRLSRIIDPSDGRAVVVAADHGFMMGSIKGVADLERTLKSVILGGPDAVLLSPGQARRLNRLFHGRRSPAIIVRSDWTNAFRDKTYTLPARSIERTAVASARDAFALGASGILTYYFIGHGDDDRERRELELMARFARGCSEVGLPFLVEPLPMGERVTGANFAELVATAVRIAVEVGADVIKTPYTGDIDSFRRVVRAAGGVPVLVLGGAKAKTMRDALEVVLEALEAGASGVVYGRQVVQAQDPAEFVRSIRAVVHEGKRIEDIVGATRLGPIRVESFPDRCTGCRMCELACSFGHEQEFTFSGARLRVEFGSLGDYKPVVCSLCGLCVKACPTGALTLHPTLGYVRLDRAKCDGCRDCVEACPLRVIRFDDKRKIPLICDMCEGAPACVEWCQPRALTIAEMKMEDS